MVNMNILRTRPLTDRGMAITIVPEVCALDRQCELAEARSHMVRLKRNDRRRWI